VKRSLGLAFAVDFKDLAMSFHVLRAKQAPRIGSRDYATDGPENVTGGRFKPVRCETQSQQKAP
jgi:hypothetical protein